MNKNGLLTNVLLIILGALAAGVVALAVEMYLLMKNQEASQKKEVQLELRKDIDFLTRLADDLDENTVIANQDLMIDAQFDPASARRDDRMDPETKRMAQLLKALVGEYVRVRVLKMPPKGFLTVGCYPESTGNRIRYEVVKRIRDTCTNLWSVNANLNRLTELTQSDVLTPHAARQVEELAKRTNDLMAKVSAASLIDLRKSVVAESDRLAEEIKKYE
jgi:hypothetical protein